jgi:hypothetical protein
LRIDVAQKVGGKDLGMTETGTSTMKVLANTGGKVTLKTSFTDLKFDLPPNSPMRANLDAIRKKASMPTTMVLDSTCRLLSLNGKPVSPELALVTAFGGGGTLVATFPTKPVAAGQSWTYDLDLSKTATSGMKTSGKLPLTFTVKSVQPGKVLLLISLDGTMTVSTLASHIKSSGTTLIETSSGMVLEMNCKTSSSYQFGGREFAATESVTMKRK